jgi:uncharacterized membrane protein YdjX (TVP38/TMEM64 family)
MKAASGRSFWQTHWQKLLAALFWLAGLAAYLTFTLERELTPLDSLELLVGAIETQLWGPLVFLGLYTVRPLFLFSASLLSVASGFLFGPVFGILYTVLGSNASATVAYLLARFFAQGVFKDTGGFNRYLSGMRARSFETVLIMRLLFLPYDLVNYLAGSFKLRYLSFISASALGSLPGTIAFVLFGASLSSLREAEPSVDWRVFAASLAIFSGSFCIARRLRRQQGVAHD